MKTLVFHVGMQYEHEEETFRYSQAYVKSVLVDKALDCTIQFGEGIWQGQEEPTAIITVVVDDALVTTTVSKVMDLARAMNQQSVLVRELNENSYFVDVA